MSKTCLVAAYEDLDTDYQLKLKEFLEEDLKWTLVNSTEDKPDVILYVNGPEPSPEMYGVKKDRVDLKRDGKEAYLFYWSQFVADYPVWNIGIQRGMHLLTILNGGKLTSAPTDHNFTGTHLVCFHPPEDDKKTKFYHTVESSHEKVVVMPSNGKQKHHPSKIIVDTTKNSIEAVYFDKSKTVGIQWDPINFGSGSRTIFKEILKHYVFPGEDASEVAA